MMDEDEDNDECAIDDTLNRMTNSANGVTNTALTNAITPIKHVITIDISDNDRDTRCRGQ